MKITRSQLRKFIQEQVATVNDDAIEDVVMDVLSDEGGAAGLEPIEDALEELEDDEFSDEDFDDDEWLLVVVLFDTTAAD